MATVRLVPMTRADYDAWHDAALSEYARDRQQSDGTTPEEAYASARQEVEALLPEGPASPGMHLLAAVDAQGGESIGLAERGSPACPQGFIYDIRVWPEVRGQAYGRAILAAIEPEAQRLGLGRIGLHVFGYNAVAIRLYETSGHRITNFLMAKDLG